MTDEENGEWNFASDNVAPVAPEIMAAIVESNSGSVSSYGSDPWSAKLTARLREVFETDLVAYPVATGTAANALALSVITPSYGSIICAQDAHINTDECGAPEFYTAGAKLIGLPSTDGKMSVDLLEKTIAQKRTEGLQTAQPHAVSITQSTEWGVVYDTAHITAISGIAAANDISLHMDGARFANGLVRLGCSPAEMTWKAGVDALSFGATKNGAMAAEMVIIFDRGRTGGLAARHKRAGHLWSKARFLSAQLIAYLENDLWLRNAATSNAMAQRLARGLSGIAGVHLIHPVQANQVFATMPQAAIDAITTARFRFAQWTRGPLGEGALLRFVTSYSTTQSAVDALISCTKAAMIANGTVAGIKFEAI
jgi:threonine aldolase